MKPNEQSGIVISNQSGGDWKVAIVGAGFVILGVGVAVLAAQLGIAVIILAAGGAVGVAAFGIGRGLEHARRGKGFEKAGEALIVAARRGELRQPADMARAVITDGSTDGRGGRT